MIRSFNSFDLFTPLSRICMDMDLHIFIDNLFSQKVSYQFKVANSCIYLAEIIIFMPSEARLEIFPK